jgi:uncharacterized protein YcbX
MRLASLHVYPIKSCGGFSPETWQADDHGFLYDRRWMLVDPAGEFITQREQPRMALIRVSVEHPHLRVEAPGMPKLTLPLEPMGGRPMKVRVWRDQVEAWLPDQQADRWFTECLGLPCGLAYMPEDILRPVDPQYAAPWREISFADGFPFLIIGQGSLDDLNRRLTEPVSMNRFRPNLVIEGAPPFAEDRWRQIRIGDLAFELVKPCARCVITTTDQATAARGVEPLRTLATYRTSGSSVMFGQNALHDSAGWVKRGEGVEVLEAAEGEQGTGKGS